MQLWSNHIPVLVNGTVEWWPPGTNPDAEGASPVAVSKVGVTSSQGMTFQSCLVPAPVPAGRWAVRVHHLQSRALLAELAFPVVDVRPSYASTEAMDALIRQFWSVQALCQVAGVSVASTSGALSACVDTVWSSYSQLADMP